MSFVSFAFLVLFGITLGIRLTIGRRKTEPAYLAALIGASVVFYSWHIPVYIALLLGSTFVDFVAARLMLREAKGSTRRRAILIVSLVVNLGVLGAFKYADFLIEPTSQLIVALGLGSAVPSLDLALPLGVSFYTFQSMSYTIDVYRGAQQPVARFWQLFLFVGFFPQLVAGPIVRARDFLYQIGRRRRVNFRVWSEGAFLIIQGFFLKMVCANNIAPYVDRVFSRSGGETNSTVLLLGAVLFGCQIFCDFAGYSSIARGAAYVLGFRLPVNFNNPYLAGTFSEFWGRWHITLSQWLRDYLYIPLGGNRISERRTLLNLLLVMLLGGLWHGAAWTYVLWGALHGGALVVERLLGLNRLHERAGRRALRLLWFATVQTLVFLAWIFFRCATLKEASAYIANLLGGSFGPVPDQAWFPLFVAIPVLLMHVRGFITDRAPAARVTPLEKAILAGLMLVATLTLYGQDSAFIYFQF